MAGLGRGSEEGVPVKAGGPSADPPAKNKFPWVTEENLSSDRETSLSPNHFSIATINIPY